MTFISDNRPRAVLFHNLNCTGSSVTRRINEPCHSDADRVEHEHRSSEKAHVKNVGGGRRDCCDNENDKYGVPQITQHPPGCYKPHQSQKEHQNWHFEDQAETYNDGHKQPGIFSDRNHWLKLLSETNQEIERRRVNRLVAENTSGYEQPNRT